jgi:hypothetical protein
MAELAFRALVYLLPSELGGRKAPLPRGAYRPNWNLGHTWLGEPTLNDGRVLLDAVEQLAPGNAAQARIEPLIPEYWGRVGVGSVLPMQEGAHVVGNATVFEVLSRAEHLRPEICDFVDQARQYCDFVQRAASYSLSERIQGARVRLLELYGAGTRLPEVMPPDEERTSPSAPEPQLGFESFDRYTEIFDPYVVEDRNPVDGPSPMISWTSTGTFRPDFSCGIGEARKQGLFGNGGSGSGRTGASTPSMLFGLSTMPARTPLTL